MKRSLFKTSLSRIAAGLTLAAVLCSGCSKSASQSKVKIEITAKIPGAGEAKAALEKKDYEALLQSIGTASGAAESEMGQKEFRKLCNQVMDALDAVRENDPKAQDAYDSVRVLIMGR